MRHNFRLGPPELLGIAILGATLGAVIGSNGMNHMDVRAWCEAGAGALALPAAMRLRPWRLKALSRTQVVGPRQHG